VSLPPGTLVAGDFRIVSPIAEGGMGEVYVAEQISTGKRRALKLMKPELMSDAALVARFEQEAKISARIASDHVVEIVGAGVDHELGAPWLAMELLQGQSLAAALKQRGQLPASMARSLFAQLAHGLGAAHRAGVVHRDLKPENIFIAEVQQLGVDFKVKVLDFGIAKLFEGAKTSNTGMMSLGTPRYMAPEQTGGQPITPATDVWALGLIAFQVLTGRYYWRNGSGGPNDSMMTLMREVLFEQLVPASRRAAEFNVAQLLPAGFDQWFARCVAREPNERFQNAADALNALDPILAVAAPNPSHAMQSAASPPQRTQVDYPAGMTAQGYAHSAVAAHSGQLTKPVLPAAPQPKASGGYGLAVGITAGALLLAALGVGGYVMWNKSADEKKAKRAQLDDDERETKKRRKKVQTEDDETADSEPSASAIKPVPTAPPAPINRAGRYKISHGVGIDGDTYTGTVTITPFGGGYRALWSTDFVGIMLESDGLVAGTWGPDPHVAAIYQVDGGTLSGKTMDGATGRLGSHTIEGPPGLNGSYSITASSAGDHGTVTIRPNGKTYSLVATMGSQSMKGAGLLDGNQLAVGWTPSSSRSGGVVAFRANGSALSGPWTFHGEGRTGTENLELMGP
jgi:serine/threonine protein kinase